MCASLNPKVSLLQRSQTGRASNRRGGLRSRRIKPNHTGSVGAEAALTGRAGAHRIRNRFVTVGETSRAASRNRADRHRPWVKGEVVAALQSRNDRAAVSGKRRVNQE